MKTRVLGIVGTAKNTGKTTTLVSLAEAIQESGGERIAVTSIGYDGETVDSLTFLPKPRIALPAGALVATAERCLENARLEAEVACRTGISTALGEVFLLRVTSPGRIVVAGPNQRDSLAQVISALEAAGADRILVDGALGRLAPMAAAEGIIFTTGAARSTDLNQLAEEMRAIDGLLGLPVYSQESAREAALASITIQSEDGQFRYTGIPNLLDEEQADALLRQWSPRPHAILLPGVVTTHALDYLVDRLGSQVGQVHFVADNPLLLLLADEPPRTWQTICSIEKIGGRFSVLRPVPLLAVTVNPFYPARFRGGPFDAAYVDKTALKEKIAAAVRVPVVNVREEGSQVLLRTCGTGGPGQQTDSNFSSNSV